MATLSGIQTRRELRCKILRLRLRMTPVKKMPLLEIQNVVYGVGPDGKTPILSGLSLSLERGEVHALLGANGTGKSTLASLIMGCEGYRPSSGEMLLEGSVINDLPIHERAQRGIAMAWQEPVRFEGILVRDYLTLKKKDIDAAAYLRLAGLSPELCLDRMVDKA